MTVMKRVMCTAEGLVVGVVGGSRPTPRRDEPPHATALRLDGTATPLTFEPSPSKEGAFLISYERVYRGPKTVDYIFPHWGDVKDGQRLATDWHDKDKSNRLFCMHQLRSGGYHIQSSVDPALYIGLGEDGYLILTTKPVVWFLVE
jgi:hypothetical protein